jgi:hypothetical protein
MIKRHFVGGSNPVNRVEGKFAGQPRFEDIFPASGEWVPGVGVTAYTRLQMPASTTRHESDSPSNLLPSGFADSGAVMG